MNIFDELEILYHGGPVVVKLPEIRTSRYTKDFGDGFYCTRIKSQSKKWSIRKSFIGVVSIYEYTKSTHLKYKLFSENDEWLDFVADCRGGLLHNYDIIEGPMADDQIWEFIDDYLSGTFSREQFWAIAKFRYPTHQISFHSDKALETLKYIGEEEVRRDV
jgi:hypothetical protein